MLAVDPVASDPLARLVAIEVLDPGGHGRVPGAEVTATARHALFGSALRTGPVRFVPGVEQGTYRGRMLFPRGGSWDLTISVRGKYVGDAHFTVEVPPAPGEGEGEAGGAERPELVMDRFTLRHLAMEWGHLVGFGMWLAASVLGLAGREGPRWPVLLLTWTAFAVEGVTGLYKMEYSTPFASGLPLLRLDRIPPIYFAREYVYTLVVKHLLLVGAIGVTAALSVHVWRSKPGERSTLFRALLVANLALALAIGAAAAILGFYHAIVLHFS
ncbi:MAG: hypothetical protein ACREKA_06235 [Candidatus Methylomirabilales bacterium]